MTSFSWFLGSCNLLFPLLIPHLLSKSCNNYPPTVDLNSLEFVHPGPSDRMCGDTTMLGPELHLTIHWSAFIWVHSFECIHLSAFTLVHSLERIHLSAFTWGHSLEYIHLSAFTWVHSLECIPLSAFTWVLSLECIQLTAFTLLHSL